MGPWYLQYEPPNWHLAWTVTNGVLITKKSQLVSAGAPVNGTCTSATSLTVPVGAVYADLCATGPVAIGIRDDGTAATPTSVGLRGCFRQVRTFLQ
jgi:hypothetical protein